MTTFSSVLAIKKTVKEFFSFSFSFSAIILKEYDWSPSSMTFSLRAFSKDKEQGEKDGEREERLLIFKQTEEGEKEGV